MTIDYDRLRELADEHTPGPWEQATRGQIGNRELRMIVALVGGDESGEQIGDSNLEADRELIALAPDMARELLRLRDGVQDIRGTCHLAYKFTTQGDTPEHKAVGENLKEVVNLLDHLLDGDTE